jgi:hypothetical protein
VTSLGPDNFAQVANNPEGRFLVVAAVHAKDVSEPSGGSTPTKSSAVLSAIRRLADPSTSSLPPTTRDAFIFAWLDAVPFEGFLEQFGIKAAEAPHVVVLDGPNKSFWYDASADEEDELDTW